VSLKETLTWGCIRSRSQPDVLGLILGAQVSSTELLSVAMRLEPKLCKTGCPVTT